MATTPKEPDLTTEQRRALALLDSILPGVTEDQLALVHGFDRDMIAGLVHAGLATPHRETIDLAPIDPFPHSHLIGASFCVRATMSGRRRSL
jgi:hypothetical protein